MRRKRAGCKLDTGTVSRFFLPCAGGRTKEHHSSFGSAPDEARTGVGWWPPHQRRTPPTTANEQDSPTIPASAPTAPRLDQGSARLRPRGDHPACSCPAGARRQSRSKANGRGERVGYRQKRQQERRLPVFVRRHPPRPGSKLTGSTVRTGRRQDHILPSHQIRCSSTAAFSGHQATAAHAAGETPALHNGPSN